MSFRIPSAFDCLTLLKFIDSLVALSSIHNNALIAGECLLTYFTYLLAFGIPVLIRLLLIASFG